MITAWMQEYMDYEAEANKMNGTRQAAIEVAREFLIKQDWWPFNQSVPHDNEVVMSMADFAIAYQKQAERGWAAIKDSFPDEGADVWVTSKDNGEVRESYYPKSSTDIQREGVQALWRRRVLAWKPRITTGTIPPYTQEAHNEQD